MCFVRLARQLHGSGMFAALCALAGASAEPAAAQGCIPSRFTSPALGAQGDIYIGRGIWQVGLTYREFTSDQFIVGRQVRNDLAPAGRPAVVEAHSLTANLTYGISDRLSVAMSVPFAQARHEATYADGQRHENTAAGVGEITVTMSYWLRDAHALRPGGNVAIGAGVKAPSGRNDVGGRFWSADGTSIPFPVAQAIQLGDGGWGVILNARGFRPAGDRVYLYAGGAYIVSTRTKSDVLRAPGSTAYWGVPDTWDAAGGVSILVAPETGVSLTLGTLLYGTPRQDLIGGPDDGARLPATVGYFSPGLGVTRGRHALTFSVPLRVYMDFQPSYAEEAAGRRGGGGLSRSIILTSYAVRF